MNAPARTRVRPRKHRAALAVAAALLAVLLGATAMRSDRAAVGNDVGGAPEHPPAFWNVPAFAFTDQRAVLVTGGSLLGHVWIADFIFTQCTSACPMLTARMRVLQRAMPDPDLRFISFSVDPVHDTADALVRYAALWAPEETRWSLLRTEAGPLERLTEGMRAIVQPDGDGGILHTSLFFLVDRAGRVRGIYDGNDDDALHRLTDDARRLTHAPAAPHEARSRDALRELGCRGCHDNPQIAPPLAGIWGHDVALADGTSAPVDAAYVRESIVSPSARRVAGYPDTMPSYANELSADELDELVGEIASLGGAAPGAPRAREVDAPVWTESDPVCGMTIRVTASTPYATRDGHAYHFCSDACRSRFLAAQRP
ncbi:MAG TPA: SCO family protein [Polyangiaceae bacterium]|jgi:protein SCO1/2|nr:SCO family protein [Polyangiaceae bacterium]